MSPTRTSAHRGLALGGILAPATFTAVVVVAGWIRPDYSHLRQFISELGATGTVGAPLMNYAGFIPTGVMLLLFARATRALILGDAAAALGCAFLHFFGVAVLVAGIVRCDEGCPIARGSLSNLVHGFGSPVAFLCAVGAMAGFGWALRRRAGWVGLGGYSLGSAVVALGLMVVLAASLRTREWTGLWQRILLTVVFSWCLVVALRLRRAGGGSA